jgi:hypothetical protein
MPFKRARYPADWGAISASIRERAGNRCEWLGCGLDNGATVQGKRSPYRMVLTVAHLTHIERDCRPESLRAWCQPHHLRYDAVHHAQSAATTRRQHKRTAGQLEMFNEEAHDAI